MWKHCFFNFFWLPLMCLELIIAFCLLFWFLHIAAVISNANILMCQREKTQTEKNHTFWKGEFTSVNCYQQLPLKIIFSFRKRKTRLTVSYSFLVTYSLNVSLSLSQPNKTMMRGKVARNSALTTRCTTTPTCEDIVIWEWNCTENHYTAMELQRYRPQQEYALPLCQRRSS